MARMPVSVSEWISLNPWWPVLTRLVTRNIDWQPTGKETVSQESGYLSLWPTY